MSYKSQAVCPLVESLTSGCCGHRCGLLTTLVEREEGDDIFSVGLKTCQIVAGDAARKGEALRLTSWREEIHDKIRRTRATA